MMMNWDRNEEEQRQQDTKLDNHNNNNNDDNSINNEGTGNNNQNQSNSISSTVMFVKVMTDEQMETLRKQIAVYATICDQLVLLHMSLSAHQDLSSSAPVGKLGSLYCDPLMASGGQKITARQRWTPTPVQLQTLERIFDQGNGTLNKEKIKEITAELSQHGQISETNAYYWFQNRRARSKKKQLVASSNNNSAESDVETQVDSLNEKTTKPEISLPTKDSYTNV